MYSILRELKDWSYIFLWEGRKEKNVVHAKSMNQILFQGCGPGKVAILAPFLIGDPELKFLMTVISNNILRSSNPWGQNPSARLNWL
jgi:hypothetical protein